MGTLGDEAHSRNEQNVFSITGGETGPAVNKKSLDGPRGHPAARGVQAAPGAVRQALSPKSRN